jgi:hypothetical protein
MRSRHNVESRLPPLADDDLVAKLMERLGQAAADARTATSDEYGISF